MEENMLSVISNGGDHVSTGGSDSSSVIYPTPPGKHVRQGSDETLKKFKGVVPQQNGNWGAQIYANNQRVWLGTFKSEKEAAMAYDSAAIQLRYGDSHRNFPWTSITVEEPNFQTQYSKEDVLDMIKDGSYQLKFAEFLRIQARARVCYQLFEAAKGLNLSAMQKRGGLSYNLLFEKELTPSDVGKLNRLVIPKKDAITYFPDISERVEEDAQASGVADMQLGFFDRMMRSWRFRYCYWKSSQSFVFTRGWSRFVKDKQLTANDVIAFYLCELKEGGKAVETFFMIDFSKGEESGSSDEGADHNVEQRLDVSEKKLEEEMMETDPPSSTEKKGFRLFGVQII